MLTRLTGSMSVQCIYGGGGGNCPHVQEAYIPSLNDLKHTIYSIGDFKSQDQSGAKVLLCPSMDNVTAPT